MVIVILNDNSACPMAYEWVPPLHDVICYKMGSFPQSSLVLDLDLAICYQ